jgi:hypothetical protein
MLTRLLDLIGVLLSAHVESARNEASRDARRFLGAVLLLGASMLLLIPASLLAHAAAAMLVHDTWPIGWTESLLAVAAADVAVGVPVYLWARRRLGAPLLTETRALVRRTAAALADSR